MARLPHLLESIFASQGGYFADTLYAFKPVGQSDFELQSVDDRTSHTLRWLILGREHYFETSKEYPIANKRDLKRALHFDDNKAPFSGVTLQHIERVNEQSHRVTFWVINPNVLKQIACSPWLILPESYLLAKAMHKQVNLATIKCISKTLYISQTGQGICSGVQSQQTPNVESFAFSTGSPLSVNTEQYFTATADNFVGLLIKGLKSLELTMLQGFLVQLNDTNWKTYPWKQAGIIAATVFSAYLMATSAWLVFKQESLDYKISAQKEVINQALSLQKKYQQELQWQQTLSKPLEGTFPYWYTWPTTLEVIAVGSKITAVHYKNNKIIIHGETNKGVKATDVLAKLSDNANVVSPSFSQPVRKRRDKESFAISFSFADIAEQQQAKQE